jgi:5-methylthioadenosine/S-adenosylhomocysteine deaminase
LKDNMANLIIAHADWLVTVDDSRRIFRDGALAIEADKIVAVGKTEAVLAHQTAARVIDAKGKLVLPGLINAHAHNTQQLARGLANDCHIQEWLYGRVYPFEASLSAEEALLSAQLCQLEMIKSGTTCFLDPGSHFPDEVARAATQSGMRCVLTRSTMDIHSNSRGSLPQTRFRESTDEAVARLGDAISRLHGSAGGRIRASASLRNLYTASDRLITEVKALADRHKTLVQSHVAGNHSGPVASLARHDCRDVERLERLSVLDDRWLLIHMNWVSPRELDLLTASKAKVAHCPGAGVKGGWGTFSHGRFPEMIERGICVCLGTDSGPSGNFMDLTRAMYLAACGFKDSRMQAATLTAEGALEMATINGARAALWEDSIGSLEVGKKADVCLWNLNRAEWRPVVNPIGNLVYSADGSSVDTVIVDGNILVEGGVIKTLDEKALLREATPVAQRIAERAGVLHHGKPLWPVE